MKTFFIALRYTRGYGFYAAMNIVFNILSAVFNLLSLVLFIPFLKLIFTPVEGVANTKSNSGFDLNAYFDGFMQQLILDHGKVGALFYICIIILCLFFLKNVTRYLAMYFLAVIRNGVVRDIRNQLFDKLLALPLGYYSEERKGDLLTRVGSDVYEIELSVMSTLELIFREPFTILIFLGSMILISPSLTMISLVLMPLSALVIGRVGKSLKRTSKKGQAKLGEVMAAVEETLGGLRIIKSFTAENEVREHFRKQNDDFTRLSTRLYRKRDLASPLSEFLGSIVMIAMVWFGGKMILQGEGAALEGEDFITFIIVFSQLLRPIQGIASANSNINKGLASIDRVNHILHAEDKITEKENALTVSGFERDIVFRDVSFSYTDRSVLQDVSFTIQKGKTIALVGQSGSGKSTIADLLPRFYDVKEGAILIDGKDLRDLKLRDLRKLLGMVSQESILFNESVLHNIALGDPQPDRAKAIEAARIANALEFIEKLEGGLDANIGERGGKLSGGQRQRLAIARAVYKNPPVLILDEATSALDTESERLVQDALNKLMQNRTTLVIAHRLSTIQHADEILVLQEGKIIERGNHNSLYSANGVYRKLCDMQSFV
jgi:subfamily B ATP-binding cassette protein MsbA